MSLHKFADMVAKQGRGDDSLLIHMTPDEVQRLQQFAEANGRSLTINPETGLPEAGMLSDLFKAIAPIALGAFLGPAGMGLTIGGLSSAATAGLVTGGITSLATGSLSRGLMAGLGAYGGAGLAEGLMGAGGNALVAGGAPIGAENIAGVAVPPIEQVNPSNFNLSGADKLAAGAKAITATPEAFGSFAKQNLGNLAYAAAPIAAGMMVPTTTQMPATKNENYIRQYDFNIDPETGRPSPLYGLRAMTPVKANEWGNKTFEGQRQLFRQQNPNPYELGVGSLNQPPQPVQPARMNSGGIVALARGNVPGYAEGDLILDAYKKGDYDTANRLIGEQKLSAQDVVSRYKLNAGEAADVARNLGYAGDRSALQYGTGYVESPVIQAPPVVQATQTAPPVVQTAPPVTQVTTPVTQATTPVTQVTMPAPETEAQWKARQPTNEYLNSLAPMERRAAFESWQMTRPGWVNPMDYTTFGDYVKAGGAGEDITSEANFYGTTIENLNKAKAGQQNNYFDVLRSPIERLADQAARGQGIAPTTQSPEMQALMQKYPTFFVDYAKKHPEIFNKASQDWHDYMTTTYPGTLEYQSVLSGPMKYSSTGVEYPKIDNTASMYVLDPATKQIKVNPDYSATKSDGTARMYIRDPVTGRIVKNPKYKPPVRAAEGGLMGLANGVAVQHFAVGDLVKSQLEQAYAANDVNKLNELVAQNKITAGDVSSTWEGFDTSGIKGLQLYTPPAAPTYTQYTPEQIGSYLSNPVNKDINIQDAIKATNADPYAVNQYIAKIDDPFRDATLDTRGSGTFGIFNNMVTQGIDPNELRASNIALDPKYATQGWSTDKITNAYNLTKGSNELNAAKQGKTTDTDWAKLMVGNGTWDKPQYSVNDMAQVSGLSINEVNARYELEKLKAKAAVVTPPVVTPVKPVIYNTAGTNLPTPIESIQGLPPGVSGAGVTIVNPNGTITTRPNIPGIPEGGFTGMTDVRKAYTDGGGSLGYTAKAPKNMEEFNQLYNKQTGDSLAAYNYLMGKGANKNAYPVKSGVPKIAVPYDEFVLGRKPASLKPKTTTTTTEVKGTPGQPQTYFDEKAYLAAHPDVEAELKTGKSISGQPVQFTSGYEHWLKYGQPAGWAFSGDYAGYITAAALAAAAGAGGGGGPGNDGGGGVGGTGGGGSGGNAAGAAAAAAGGNAASGTGNSAASAAAASAAAAAAGIGVGDSAASGGKRGGQVLGYAMGGGLGSLGSYSDGGRLLKGPGDGVSDSIPATIGQKQQPARLADGEFVIPARIVSELGNGSTDAGAKKLYAMMDRVQRARGKTTGKNKVAANSRSDKYLPA